MPSTSPYQNNDYQAANTFRPYRLPINDIFKANTAIDTFWDIGAKRVDNVYENALGLNLTSNANIEAKNKYMEDAEKSLVKLSSMNLADPSIQRQGFGIFKPLLSDKSIQIDNHLTNLRASIINTANQYKTSKLSKNGVEGEGYNETNLRDALDGFQDLNSQTPRDENVMTQLYGKLSGKSYQPYYDYSKDMMDVVKNCKGTTDTSAGTNGNYIQTITHSGATDARLQACLEYSLNDKAKSQMGIEGRQTFKNGDGTINYKALADTYSSRFARDSQGLKEQDEKTSARLVAYKQQYAISGDPEVKKAIDFEQSLLDSNKERYKNLIESYSRIKLGDKDFLDKNYERLATSIYYNSKVDGYAQAYRNDVAKSQLDEDAVALQRDRLAATQTENILDRAAKVELENLKYQHDLAVEAIKQGKKLDKNGNPINELNPTDPASISADKTARGIDDFKNDLLSTQNQALGITKGFYNGNVAKDWRASGKNDSDFYNPQTGQLTTAAIQYLTDKKIMDTPEVTRYFNEIGPLNWKTTINSTIMDAVEDNQDIKKLSAGWRQSLQDPKKFGKISFNDNGHQVIITATDVQDALEGKISPLRIVKGNIGSTRVSASGNVSINSGGDYVPDEYYINGKRIDAQYEIGKGINPLHDLVQQVMLGNQNNNNKIIEAKNRIFSQAFLASEGRVDGEGQNVLGEKSHPKSMLLTAANSAGGAHLEIGDVRIIDYSPLTGKGSAVISQGAVKAKIPDMKDFISTLNTVTGADQSIQHVSKGDGNLIIDFVDKTLIDERLSSNPYVAVQYSLNSIENVLKNTDHSDIGTRIEKSAITVPDPRDRGTSFKAIPYKDLSGQIMWELQIEWKGPSTDIRQKGQYYKMTDNLTKDQIISKIYDPTNK